MKPALTLGELSKKLEVAAYDPEVGDTGKPVYFDWCDAIPTTFHSDRGRYEDVALGVTFDGYPEPVNALYHATVAAMRATYDGWKGGRYKMTPNTKVRVGNEGKWTQYSIVDIIVNDHDIVLETRKIVDD